MSPRSNTSPENGEPNDTPVTTGRSPPTLCAAAFAIAFAPSPRPAAVVPSRASAIVPPFNPNALAPTLIPSASASKCDTEYWNVSVFVPVPLA